MQHGSDRVRVVGRKLRVDAVRHAEQLARAGNERDVRRTLAGEDGEARNSLDLGSLDLRVPVGALHEPHHDPSIQLVRQLVEPFDHVARALAVGLNDNAEPIPSREGWIAQHGFDYIEREIEAVSLLRVDVQPHPDRLRGAGEVENRWHQLIHHAIALRHLVTGMQCGKLYRDARVVARVVRVSGLSQLVDSRCVGFTESFGVRRGHRGLAQHVVGVSVARLLQPSGTLRRFLDRLPQHELLAHLSHRAGDGLPYDRFPQSPCGGAQEAARLIRAKHPSSEREGKRRGVHQCGARMAEMFDPSPGRDLVGNQCVHGGSVRHAQKRFGQTHQS